MQRKAAVAALIALIALIATPSAPTRDSAVNRYLRLTATRAVHEFAKYRDPTGLVGDYERYAAWQLRAIIVFDGSAIRIVPGAAIVGGHVSVHDTRTYNPTGHRLCAATAATNLLIDNKTFIDAPHARASIVSNRLTVTPSRHIRWNLGCGSDQTLEAHGVNGALAIDIPRPGPSLRQGGTYYCSTDYSHEPRDHTFEGVSKMVVTLAPFRADQLPDNRTLLAGMRGSDPTVPPVIGANNPYQPDPKPKNGKCK